MNELFTDIFKVGNHFTKSLPSFINRDSGNKFNKSVNRMNGQCQYMIMKCHSRFKLFFQINGDVLCKVDILVYIDYIYRDGQVKIEIHIGRMTNKNEIIDENVKFYIEKYTSLAP